LPAVMWLSLLGLRGRGFRGARASRPEPFRFEPFERGCRTSYAIVVKRGQRVVLGIAAAGIAAVVLLLGGIWSGTQPRVTAAFATASAADQQSLGQLLDGFSTGDTAGYVRTLE